jgi:hypothetical protein
MEKVPSLRTTEESAPKRDANTKSKRIKIPGRCIEQFLVTFYTNVTFSMQKMDIAKDDQLSGK